MLGFIASFVNFLRLELAWNIIIIRALDLITIVVPPALPATLTIGTNFALSRLKNKQIYCISPQRVNVGGKIDIMCFDKTGTLTEDGLDVLGLRIASETNRAFGDLVSRAALSRNTTTRTGARTAVQAALHTMATCHSLRVVDGDLVGDPLDQKMFEFTGWSFEEGKQRFADGENDEHGGLTPSIARPPDVCLNVPLHLCWLAVPRLTCENADCCRVGCPKVLRVRLSATTSQRHHASIRSKKRRNICQGCTRSNERYMSPRELSVFANVAAMVRTANVP